MPELPDVEIFKRYLDAAALRQRIAAVHVQAPRLIGKVGARRLQAALKHRQLVGSRRHGKWLFAQLDAPQWLVLHFGMTGALVYHEQDSEPPHAVMTLDFENGAHLTFTDRRRLGTLDLADDPDDFLAAHDVGPDALQLTWAQFKSLLAARRGGIKSALMDQSLLAGLGNVYTDEVLFQTDIHPLTPLPKLDDTQRRQLFDKIREVLTTAVAADAERAHMPRTYLLTQRRDGASCPRCGGSVRQISVNGRSTYFCERHQKRPA